MFNPTATVSPARDAELAARGLPAVAYIPNDWNAAPGAASVYAVRRGETGFHPIKTRRSADELNEATGVSQAQAKAMHAGSMFGWHVGGAYPSTHTPRPVPAPVDIAL